MTVGDGRVCCVVYLLCVLCQLAYGVLIFLLLLFSAPLWYNHPQYLKDWKNEEVWLCCVAFPCPATQAQEAMVCSPLLHLPVACCAVSAGLLVHFACQ